jgi:hypothetical protein
VCLLGCPRFELQGLSPEFTWGTQHTFAANGVSVVAMGQDLRALSVKNNVPYRLYFGFRACLMSEVCVPYVNFLEISSDSSRNKAKTCFDLNVDALNCEPISTKFRTRVSNLR